MRVYASVCSRLIRRFFWLVSVGVVCGGAEMKQAGTDPDGCTTGVVGKFFFFWLLAFVGVGGD